MRKVSIKLFTFSSLENAYWYAVTSKRFIFEWPCPFLLENWGASPKTRDSKFVIFKQHTRPCNILVREGSKNCPQMKQNFHVLSGNLAVHGRFGSTAYMVSDVLVKFDDNFLILNFSDVVNIVKYVSANIIIFIVKLFWGSFTGLIVKYYYRPYKAVKIIVCRIFLLSFLNFWM